MSVTVRVDATPVNKIGDVMREVVLNEINEHLSQPETQARMNNEFFRRARGIYAGAQHER